MKISFNLYQENFSTFQSFSQHFNDSNRIYETVNGVSKEQVVPFLYLVNNGDIEIKGLNIPERKVVFQPGDDDAFISTVSIPGIAFILVSSEPKVLLVFQQFNDIFNSKFSTEHCNYYVVHTVDRDCILHYRKDGRVKFHAVNPKKSDMIRHNTRRAARGLIPHLVMKGVTNLTARLEDDLKVTEGVKFTLSFLSDGQETSIELIADLVYEQDFDAFLSRHWSTQVPVPEPVSKKGGCYIATACYHSYDHPSVMVLRHFRDDVLLEDTFGRLFVKIYYKYSPFWANKLRDLPTINRSVRLLFLDPIVRIISNRSRK